MEMLPHNLKKDRVPEDVVERRLKFEPIRTEIHELEEASINFVSKELEAGSTREDLLALAASLLNSALIKPKTNGKEFGQFQVAVWKVRQRYEDNWKQLVKIYFEDAIDAVEMAKKSSSDETI